MSIRIRLSLSMTMIVVCAVGMLVVLICNGIVPFFVALTNISQCAGAVALAVAGCKWRKWYLFVASVGVFGEVVLWCVGVAIVRRYADVWSPSVDIPELRWWNNAGFFALIVARFVLLVGAIGFLDEVNRGSANFRTER